MANQEHTYTVKLNVEMKTLSIDLDGASFKKYDNYGNIYFSNNSYIYRFNDVKNVLDVVYVHNLIAFTVNPKTKDIYVMDEHLHNGYRIFLLKHTGNWFESIMPNQSINYLKKRIDVALHNCDKCADCKYFGFGPCSFDFNSIIFDNCIITIDDFTSVGPGGQSYRGNNFLMSLSNDGAKLFIKHDELYSQHVICNYQFYEIDIKSKNIKKFHYEEIASSYTRSFTGNEFIVECHDICRLDMKRIKVIDVASHYVDKYNAECIQYTTMVINGIHYHFTETHVIYSQYIDSGKFCIMSYNRKTKDTIKIMEFNDSKYRSFISMIYVSELSGKVNVLLKNGYILTSTNKVFTNKKVLVAANINRLIKLIHSRNLTEGDIDNKNNIVKLIVKQINNQFNDSELDNIVKHCLNEDRSFLSLFECRNICL